ncbi:MAG TPA: efflux RND transporter periplasmic adaptor subunit [Burkholderiaceae bacterium]|nr:efflux RND transporter periplasmic adaptor subunit [Burkholderiaceae bacterium]
MTISRPLPVLWLAAVLALAACGKRAPDAGGPKAGATPTAAPVLLLGPEDLLTVRAGGGLAGGPVVTGSVQPERRADLRAEVAAVVTQVLKDNGEPVRRGELLMRLDDTSIRESLQSAEAGLRAAEQAFEQAERQVARLKTLQAQGMSSVQAVDDAEGRRNAAQSELVAARSRVVSAQQQLRRTEVRSPFDGVVSDRKASVGDTSQIGKELLKVIDPASMRFEGLVSADRVGDLKAGQRVAFRINGFGDAEFAGILRRIDASANATTRQVEVRVAFADPAKAPRVAGLYAEGRIDVGGGPGAPMLPEGVLVRQEGKVLVWRVQDRALAWVPVTLGPRDERSGDYPVTAGLADGDVLLRHPRGALVAGQKVEFAQAASAPAPAK